MYDLFTQPNSVVLSDTHTDRPKKKTNYSYATSGAAYHENKPVKKRIADKVLEIIKRMGETCLLQLSKELDMPQSSIAGRVNDLIEEGKVKYCDNDNYIFYEGRLRKKIVHV